MLNTEDYNIVHYNMNACDRLYGFIDYSTDVINDPLYSVYGIGATTIENGFTWKVNSDTIDNIPLLYLKIRNFGLMYDYGPILGLETRYISEVIEHIYNDAGHSIPTVNAQSNFENLEDVRRI